MICADQTLPWCSVACTLLSRHSGSPLQASNDCVRILKASYTILFPSWSWLAIVHLACKKPELRSLMRASRSSLFQHVRTSADTYIESSRLACRRQRWVSSRRD